jgi:Uma2 family endonuclease
MIVRPDAPPLTVEQYRNLPETGPQYQLIDGDLYMAPAPNRYHQDIARNLEFILLRYLASNSIGVLYHAPFDVYLTEKDVFQPDIIIILNGNRHILTDVGAEGPPDFVVEILSPKTRSPERAPAPGAVDGASRNECASIRLQRTKGPSVFTI